LQSLLSSMPPISVRNLDSFNAWKGTSDADLYISSDGKFKMVVCQPLTFINSSPKVYIFSSDNDLLYFLKDVGDAKNEIIEERAFPGLNWNKVNFTVSHRH